MDIVKNCRICMYLIKSNNYQSLFDESQKDSLQQLEELTGIKFENNANLPQCICLQCIGDLRNAFEFRKRCIRAQLYFSQALYKDKTLHINEEDIDNIANLEEEELMPEIESESIYSFGNDHDVLLQEREKELIEGDPKTEDNQSYCENEFLAPNKRLSIECEFIDTSKNECGNLNDTAQAKLQLKKCVICEQCGKKFNCKRNLKAHIMRHTGIKLYDCGLCLEKFYTHAELNRHLRIHTEERPYACQYCEKSFGDQSTRSKHERTHRNERPFSCQYCDKAFKTQYALKTHKLVHSNERLFQCDICRKSFQRQGHLLTHIRSAKHRKAEYNQKV